MSEFRDGIASKPAGYLSSMFAGLQLAYPKTHSFNKVTLVKIIQPMAGILCLYNIQRTARPDPEKEEYLSQRRSLAVCYVRCSSALSLNLSYPIALGGRCFGDVIVLWPLQRAHQKFRSHLLFLTFCSHLSTTVYFVPNVQGHEGGSACIILHPSVHNSSHE